MPEQRLIPIQDSLGFALRGIRAQKDYVDYLVKHEHKDLSILVLAPPFFREVAEETFGRTGAKVIFEDYENGILDDEVVSKTAQKNSIDKSHIITESKAIRFLRETYEENYPIIFDNLGQAHPYPDKPSLFVREKTIQEAKNKLIYAAREAKDATARHKANVIFLPFSGLKAFGTDYGETQDEKQKLKEFMSFPFEDSIPAIKRIQKKLEKHNILVIPVTIQYGALDEIHRTIFNLSKQHNLAPVPTSLDIDWTNNLEQQVGFFHVLNQWSQETGLPNIALVHGSVCLHLVEECADPQGMIAFYATHTETLKPEDDGRVYHLAVAEASGGWLRAVRPPIPYSHDYKLVANQITEQVAKGVLEWQQTHQAQDASLLFPQFTANH